MLKSQIQFETALHRFYRSCRTYSTKASVMSMFAAIGKAHALPERLFDAYTGLSEPVRGGAALQYDEPLSPHSRRPE